MPAPWTPGNPCEEAVDEPVIPIGQHPYSQMRDSHTGSHVLFRERNNLNYDPFVNV